MEFKEFNYTLFLVISLLAFCVSSCSSLTTFGLAVADNQQPTPTKYAEAHQVFLTQPNYKTLIYRNDELIEKLTPENARIQVSLSGLRAKVFLGEEIAIDTPVSPGKKTHPTPTGEFTIIGKKKDHHSNLYGTIYNSEGDRVTSGDIRKNTVPKGGKFVGAAMPYWMRLTNTGVGLHTGYVPSYPVSHGCIRLPKPIAPVIFAKAKIGTQVIIVD
jgi:lipoprotein-anchoring transpeptidase ErfK/SrfK